MNSTRKIASIDIGSNTVRLLILEVDGRGGFREIASDQAITRLGEGLHAEKRLLPHRIEATLETLVRFCNRCETHQGVTVRALATSAVREACNREEFLRRAFDKTGLKIEVIPWEEEARLTLEGVFWKIPAAEETNLIFDIGGGSTEFILSQGKKMLGIAGTSLGTVRLTENFISRHPVDAVEYGNLIRHLRTELRRVKAQLPDLAPDRLIGNAGTVTTLAALDQNIFPYDPGKIHGSLLSVERIRSLLDDLKSQSIEERRRLKPLERGREDVIIAGGALVLEILGMFGGETLLVCEYGLREGIILEAVAQAGPRDPEGHGPAA